MLVLKLIHVNKRAVRGIPTVDYENITPQRLLE